MRSAKILIAGYLALLTLGSLSEGPKWLKGINSDFEDTLFRRIQAPAILTGKSYYPLPGGNWQWYDEDYLFSLSRKGEEVSFLTKWTTWIRDPDDAIPFGHRLSLIANAETTSIELYAEDFSAPKSKKVSLEGFHLLGFVLQEERIPFKGEVPHLYLIVSDEFYEAIVANAEDKIFGLKPVMEIYDDHDRGRISQERILEFITLPQAKEKGII